MVVGGNEHSVYLLCHLNLSLYMIYYKELACTVVEAEKSQGLQSVSWRSETSQVQSVNEGQKGPMS